MPRKFETYQPKVKRNVNIFFFGPSGIGKSSLINSCLSHGEEGQFVSKECSVRRARDSTQNETHTKNIHYHHIKGTNISCIDVWGFKKNANYLRNEFFNILRAKVRDGQGMEDSAEHTTVLDNVVDIVVFVLDALTINSEGSPVAEIVAEYEPFVKEAYDQNCVVAFAVTKMDMAEGLTDVKIERDATHALTRMEYQKEFKNFKELTRAKFPDMIMVPVTSYEDGDNKKNHVVQEASGDMLDLLVRELDQKVGSSSSSNETSEFSWRTIPCDVFEGETPIEISYYNSQTKKSTSNRFLTFLHTSEKP